MKIKKGFTLIEVLVTIGILGILISVLYNIIFFQINAFNKSDRQSVAQSDVRYISDFITNELRFAKDIEILGNKSDIDSYEYKYIYIENGDVFHRGYGNNYIKKLNLENRNPSYEIEFWTEKNDTSLLFYKILSESQEFKIESSVNLLNTRLEENTGLVLKYQQPDFDEILSFLDKSNRFWYDLVKSSLEGSLNVVDGYQSSQEVDGGSLSLNVKSTTQSSGGSSLFVKLDDKTFLNVKGDINSYSITVDAKVNGGKGGYGILINGIVDNNNRDTGYMFQFDPGAYGFVIREINNASHRTTANVGAQRVSGSNYNLDHNAIYSPKHIENENFKWTNNTLTSGSDWFDRYKTEIKVQTQSDGSLILRAVIIDENGNRSNEMWFGDFGSITLNGSSFEGISLGKYKNNNGDIFGLRVWDNEGGKAKTDFYNISIGSAEPAPKKIVTNSDNITINFDDKILGGINDNKDLFVVKDILGNIYDIHDITMSDNNYDLSLKITPKLDLSGNVIPIPQNNLIIEYKKGENGIKDSFGNLVNDFKFQNGVYIQ
ncbi:prepilin-type N-terminal cleavage/methylation domain-containing protein [Acetoanaerobium pronyense]|uniref:Prepilin-type N-terminal cleavage/methylation domain-containing protein n=1 Tax=Acetoanaerobium pronyense TaxID=1482736 RepID=A0ABS4KJG2_9FIRM|nr:prepilin-type N-terminal cleavage/methylation domain-containing protein [Acetoanaerobium pronyense]MBP2027366.1 prepilin-type N-terminal cleavage/methylation domain-containing protein [Acetoanaerobium pronyense]